MANPSHIEDTQVNFDDNDNMSNPDSMLSNSSAFLHQDMRMKEDEVVIAKAETTAVTQLKFVLLTILTLSMVGAAFAVYFYTRNSEMDTFERTFSGHAAKVLESVGTTFDQTLEATDAFLVGMVSHARSTNASWPFVTLPDYAVRLSKIKSLSKAVLVSQIQLVQDDQRDAWEKYCAENNGWVQESIEIQMKDETYEGPLVTTYNTVDYIHDYMDEPVPNRSFYLPYWQNAPVVPIYSPYNWDGTDYLSLAEALPTLLDDHEVVISNVVNIPKDASDPASVEEADINVDFLKTYVSDELAAEPSSDLFYPILANAADHVSVRDGSGNVVGVFSMTFLWRDLVEDTLPPGNNGLIVVFENKCNQSFTYLINGPEPTYLGSSDLHESKYDNMVFSSPLIGLEDFAAGKRVYTGLPVTKTLCSYSLRVYPSSAMENQFVTNRPIYLTVAAVAIFAFTSIVFLMYDLLVERRQDKVMKTAVHSNAIVSSLFPRNVRDRLFNDQKAVTAKPNKQTDINKAESTLVVSAQRLTSFLRDGKSHDTPIEDGTQDNDISNNIDSSKPIADLFPEATVLFADIAGFTKWSSARQPTQVFTLLETIYGAFDKIAERRKVFKVETIGDSYVAVVGLPEPCDNHAVVMAKFARNCRDRMSALTTKLELTLGPGTVDLQLRFGLHSGPVTAGVLRGKKSRFQLFGDTVNTAARMESNGRKGWIHVSQSTADLLVAAGKGHWVIKRDDLIEAKGKGKMQTFWVEPVGTTIQPSETAAGISDNLNRLDEKTQRLIGWNSDILCRQILAIHRARTTIAMGCNNGEHEDDASLFHHESSKDMTVLDEVKEIIELPQFDATRRTTVTDNSIESKDPMNLDVVVYSQLNDFVTEIALRYRDNNAFHNFEHASHVGMSVAKLLDRIVASDHHAAADKGDSVNVSSFCNHEYSFGISCDPLTWFACVFAALIHDVDHEGVPNSQLVKEQSELAKTYKGKSVAEQNSFNVAWDLFMEERFARLRASICPTASEMQRFRQLVVNTVMATDIMDTDLRKQRDARWETAFSGCSTMEDSMRDIVNRKATTVIEHIMQASDVAHTMQHWHSYRKWNECLFKEVYMAFQCGRNEKDPSDRWYEDELGFFDHYVLPLAKKLSDCGVFGVSSDDYLNCAKKNREEWERRGRDVVADMVTKLQTNVLENV